MHPRGTTRGAETPTILLLIDAGIEVDPESSLDIAYVMLDRFPSFII